MSLIYCFFFNHYVLFTSKFGAILLAEFGLPDDNDAPTREEKKIARRLAAILRDGAAASVDVETDKDLGSDVSTDDESGWDHCDDEGEENSSTTHENDIHFDTTTVTVGDEGYSALQKLVERISIDRTFSRVFNETRVIIRKYE